MELPKPNVFGRKPPEQNPAAAFDRTTIIMSEAAKKIGAEPRLKTPLLGEMPITRQLFIWGTLWTIFVVLSFAPLIWYIANQAVLKDRLQRGAEIQTYSQRLGRDAQEASAGSAPAFARLKQDSEVISRNLSALADEGNRLKAPTETIRSALASLARQWEPVRTQSSRLLSLEKDLVGIEKNVAAISAREQSMEELNADLAAQLSQTGASAREVYLAGQLVALSRRIPGAAKRMLREGSPQDWAPSLENDHRLFQETLKSLMATAKDGGVRAGLEKVGTTYGEITPEIVNLLDNVKAAQSSKQALGPILAAADGALPEGAVRLNETYNKESSSGVIEGIVTFCLAASATVFAAFFARVLVADARRRVRTSEEANKRNQEAILRLLDELGALADGDLTVKASVTEDVTGAIADSINFTVTELRSVIVRINETAQQVADAAQQAQTISVQLLEGALRQSAEIKETSASVTDMAKSISNVSASAEESAKVALQSLSAAEKGQTAVQNAISGMNEIRQQIQETAKRIKRLGESSQEIHEIVELISDLTEQTNVLALNAAIQAASAGEAGRGFSVVAEEVQRLAERSAQATKQIGGIVKTIQTDTQNAVAAMERSTQGVVEGAKLSDAAGQALNEIGQVSRNLAELIATISKATRSQAASASKVVKNMQDILSITEQTTQGTKQTATSIGKLTDLANELRASVADFKV